MAHCRRWLELPGPRTQVAMVDGGSKFWPMMEVELNLISGEASQCSSGAGFPRNQTEVG
jgi:hypothetical protein